MITGKIKRAAIDKTKLYIAKDGTEYLDIVLIETPNNKYGDDYMIVQGIPKADRDAGQKGPILGNARNIQRGGGATQQSASKPAHDPAPKFAADEPPENPPF
jgi:hypothetical protein